MFAKMECCRWQVCVIPAGMPLRDFAGSERWMSTDDVNGLSKGGESKDGGKRTVLLRMKRNVD